MILYRGYDKPPILFSPEMNKELHKRGPLSREYRTRGGGVNLAKFLQMRGDDETNKYMSWLKAAADQDFSEDKEVARSFAGRDGFVATIDVTDEEVKSWYRGEQPVRGQDYSVSIFGVPAAELYRLEREKKYRVESMGEGLRERPGIRATGKNRVIPPNEGFEKRV